MQPPPNGPPHSEKSRIVVSVNGPGEISGWLYPFVTRFKERFPHARVCVCLVPCAFSSGSERSVAEAIAGVDAVCDTRQTWDLIFRGRVPAGFHRAATGVVLHLGGEGILTYAIARRLGHPCVAYVEDPFFGQGRFDQVFYTGFKSVTPGKVSSPDDILGEMMVDAAGLRRKGQPKRQGDRKIVGLYPGSRDYLVKYTLPFFAAVADLVNSRLPGIDWMLAKSNFLGLDFLADIPDVDDGRPLEGANLAFENEGSRPVLTTKAGTRIEVCEPVESAAMIDVALTIPGTTTAELAAMGIPMVVTLPTYWGEKAPLPGLAGHVSRIPIIGWLLKRAAALILLRKLRYVSHPNRRAGRMIVPEIIGKLKAIEAASKIVELLQSDTRQMEQDLREIMGAPGAAARLVDRIEPYVRTDASPLQ